MKNKYGPGKKPEVKTLRDEFAMAALAGAMETEWARRSDAYSIALVCYSQADAMLAERAKK